MDLLDRLSRIEKIKFSFGKNDEFHRPFSRRIGACSMHDPGYGLGIDINMPAENKLRGIFLAISREKGIFIFNINGVDLQKAQNGFRDYDDAESNNFITEWELSVILSHKDYLKSTIFHNGKAEFIKVSNAIKFKWK